MTTIKEITPTELAQKLHLHEQLFLLDVREENEVAICTIVGATHIPMKLIPLYLDQIPDDVTIVIYCHHGNRSLNVANYLVENGFEADDIYNLTGGIDAWALTVDKQMPRY
ncbi:rhodanese-like domain-containing protein [Gilliamella sp. wkB112]|uniref:rhodanese-like domain-containing protein n=1 Tax=Gilliamella sp. wkB112 TaxID=3120257 RepID=UPI00080E0392|nr:rhodanese-like domain-containing protein [Gilliamella apicola]OCG01417.1 sulfurtransferase [Gilliamella apicola]